MKTTTPASIELVPVDRGGRTEYVWQSAGHAAPGAVKYVRADVAEASLARRDGRAASEAMRTVADWMDTSSDKFSGPTHHEAEMIGMEISGPTFCSDARRCMRAGNRAFIAAARIFERETAKMRGDQ